MSSLPWSPPIGKSLSKLWAREPHTDVSVTIYTPHYLYSSPGVCSCRAGPSTSIDVLAGERGRFGWQMGGRAATTTNVLSMTPPHCASERGKPATCPTARNRPRLERKRVFAQFEHVEPNCLPARSCSSSRNMHVRGVDAAVLSRCSAQTTSAGYLCVR